MAKSAVRLGTFFENLKLQKYRDISMRRIKLYTVLLCDIEK